MSRADLLRAKRVAGNSGTCLSYFRASRMEFVDVEYTVVARNDGDDGLGDESVDLLGDIRCGA